jgi:FkbH-like protein
MCRKCIVLDLDDTLWSGIVGEDGFEGIKPFTEFQRAIKARSKSGIILAINSSNNEEEALRVIREHPYMILREDDFACIKINWENKISNMKAIAKELNIGLDSLVYFDDSPVNRELISKALPEVMVMDMPKDLVEYARAFNIFRGLPITEEDTKRREFYVEEKKRIEFADSINNIDDFISQLDIKIDVQKADKFRSRFAIPRIAQLTQKTNQFNLTTKRYTEEDISRLIEDNDMLVTYAHTSDKFGDNGIVGVCIVVKDPPEWNIEAFLLSCRVMSRRIEDRFMQFILGEAKKEGMQRVKARYIPTKKNLPCKNFLSHLGFRKEGEYWVKVLRLAQL